MDPFCNTDEEEMGELESAILAGGTGLVVSDFEPYQAKSYTYSCPEITESTPKV